MRGQVKLWDNELRSILFPVGAVYFMLWWSKKWVSMFEHFSDTLMVKLFSLRYLASGREAIYLPGGRIIPFPFCFYFRRIFLEQWDYLIFPTFQVSLALWSTLYLYQDRTRQITREEHYLFSVSDKRVWKFIRQVIGTNVINKASYLFQVFFLFTTS